MRECGELEQGNSCDAEMEQVKAIFTQVFRVGKALQQTLEYMYVCHGVSSVSLRVFGNTNCEGHTHSMCAESNYPHIY